MVAGYMLHGASKANTPCGLITEQMEQDKAHSWPTHVSPPHSHAQAQRKDTAMHNSDAAHSNRLVSRPCRAHTATRPLAGRV